MTFAVTHIVEHPLEGPLAFKLQEKIFALGGNVMRTKNASARESEPKESIGFHVPDRSEPLSKMATVVANDVVSQDMASANVWSDAGLQVVVSLPQSGTITCLVVAECQPMAHLLDGVIGGRVLSGLMKFRILVDGQVASPPESYVRGITPTAHRETRSFLAISAQAGPGRHVVTVEWLNESAGAANAISAELGPRSLSVWTTSKPRSRPGGGTPDVARAR